MSSPHPITVGVMAGRVTRGRLFGPSDAPSSGERVHPLVGISDVVIEEIVSSAQPDPVVYDQPHHEWVVVIGGSATVQVEGEAVPLTTGDWLSIPPRVRHRVTATDQGTVWLAVHVGRTDDADRAPS